MIESADNKPTDQSVEVFKELSAQLDAQLEKMKQTLKTELPRLNAALKREKIDAVDPKAKPAPPARSTAEPKPMLQSRWNGTDVVTTRGRNSSAALSVNALWLCSR